MADSKKGGTPPPSWITAIARAKIVRAYLRIENPTVADAEIAALELGMSKRNFYYLAKALRQPDAGSIGKTARPSRVSAEVEAIISDAIQRAGPDAPIQRIGRIAREEATRKSVQPPANKTIAARVRAGGNDDDADRHALHLIVDWAPLEVPVIMREERVAPYATIAIDAASKSPVGVSLSLGLPSPETVTHALLQALTGLGDDHKQIAMSLPAPAEQDWELYADLLRSSGAAIDWKPGSAGAHVGRLIGNRLAGIPLRPRLPTVEIVLRTDAYPAVTINDLALYLRERLGLPETRPEDARMDTLIQAVRSLTGT